MIRRMLLCAILALPLGGCHALMGAATGLSRPVGSADASAECADGEGCARAD